LLLLGVALPIWSTAKTLLGSGCHEFHYCRQGGLVAGWQTLPLRPWDCLWAYTDASRQSRKTLETLAAAITMFTCLSWLHILHSGGAIELRSGKVPSGEHLVHAHMKLAWICCHVCLEATTDQLDNIVFTLPDVVVTGVVSP
jgi:hypothetical protein